MFGGDGNDTIVSDDTAQEISVYGNQGDDQFFVGSVLQTDVVSVEGQLVGVALAVTPGTSFEMSLFGGAGDDYFEVNHNRAEISLFGDNGDDTFFVKALLTLDEDLAPVELDNATASVSGVTGEGSEDEQSETDSRVVDVDSLVYVENARINIDGGAGFDSVAIVGTVLSDTFYVFRQETPVGSGNFVQRIYGAGLKLRELLNIEQIKLITGPGDDRVYVYGVDLGDVGDLIINTGKGSDLVEFGGPERVVNLTVPTNQRTDFSAVSGFAPGEELFAALGLPIQQVDTFPRVVPFTVVEPGHTVDEKVLAQSTFAQILSPVILQDTDGLIDTIVFNHAPEAAGLIFEDRILRKQSVCLKDQTEFCTDPTRVEFPAGGTGTGETTDLIASYQDLDTDTAKRIRGEIDEYLINKIQFENRYNQTSLIDNLRTLANDESITLTIPAGVTYATFQNELNDDGTATVFARDQLSTFLGDDYELVIRDRRPESFGTGVDEGDGVCDEGEFCELIEVRHKTNGTKLAFETQNRDVTRFSEDGEESDTFYDTVGIRLITAQPIEIKLLAGYVQPADQATVDDEQEKDQAFHTLYLNETIPRIYVQNFATQPNGGGFERIELDMDQTGATATSTTSDADDSSPKFDGRVILDNELYSGTLSIEGSPGRDLFEIRTTFDVTSSSFSGATQTVLRGGGGNDTFAVDEAAVEGLGHQIFLIGGDGDDDRVQVTKQGDGENEIRLEKQTVEHTESETTLSLVTNALEFSGVTVAENRRIEAQLKEIAADFGYESVTYLEGLERVAVGSAPLKEVAAVTASRAADRVIAALDQAKLEFTTGACGADNTSCSLAPGLLGGRILQQTELERSVARGLINRYVSAREAKENAEAELSRLNETRSSAIRAINVIETIRNLIDKIPFVGKPSFSSVVNAFSDFVSRVPFVSGETKARWRRDFQALIRFRNNYKRLGEIAEQNRRAKTAAETLLWTEYEITTSTLNTQYQNLRINFESTADAVLEGSKLDDRIDAVEQKMHQLVTDTIGADGLFEKAKEAFEALQLGIDPVDFALLDVELLSEKIQNAVDSLNSLKRDLGREFSDKDERLIEIERRNVLPLLVLGDEIDALENRAMVLADQIPEKSAFDLIDSYLSDPNFDAAVTLYDGPFQEVVTAYNTARKHAEELVDFKEGYRVLRNVQPKMEKFQTFKTFLTDPRFLTPDPITTDPMVPTVDVFDFSKFKAAFNSKVTEFETLSNDFKAIAERARLEAQLRSLTADQQQINEVVGQNEVILSYFNDLLSSAVNRVNRLRAILPAQYLFSVRVLGIWNYLVQANWTVDPRYQAALTTKGVAARDLIDARGKSQDAQRDANELEKRIQHVTEALSDIDDDLTQSTDATETLKEELDAQYQFLRELSPIAIEILSDERGISAAADFGDASSLVSEIFSYSDTYTVSGETPGANSTRDLFCNPDAFFISSDTVLCQPLGEPPTVTPQPPEPGEKRRQIQNAVIREQSIQEYFSVLTLSGIGDHPIHVDHDSIENVTINVKGESNDTIEVFDTLGSAESSVWIRSFGGSDRFLLSNDTTADEISAFPRSVDDFFGDLFIDAGSGTNSLTIDDSGDLDLAGDQIAQDSLSGTATVGDVQIDLSGFMKLMGLADGDIHYGAVGGDFNGDEDGIEILTSLGSDVIELNALFSGQLTTLRTGGGDEQLTIAGFDPAGASLIIYTDEGNDLVDGELSPIPLTVFGGADSDVIRGSQFDDTLGGSSGNNLIIGNAGKDTISAEEGSDVVSGDSVQLRDALGMLLSLDEWRSVVTLSATESPNDADDTITASGGDDIVFGGGGNDTINAQTLTGGSSSTAEGSDIVVGDYGTARFNSFPDLDWIETTNHSSGGNDIITVDDGSAIALGGAGADEINTGNGNNTVLGDGGRIELTGGLVSMIESLGNDGGDDTIIGGAGDNRILGGAARDTINVGTGRNIVIGDDGKAEFVGGDLSKIQTIRKPNPNDERGDVDTITALSGNAVIFGGWAGDSVLLGDGDNIVVGDQGVAEFIEGKLAFVRSDGSDGGDDTITSGVGNNRIIGGAGGDTINVQSGNNVVLGDNGEATFTNTQNVSEIKSTDFEVGGVDTISATDGNAIIIGGAKGDTITLGNGDHTVLGDHGQANYDALNKLDVVMTIEGHDGGVDTISSDDGNTVILGGFDGDSITVGSGNVTVLGDNGTVDFNGDNLSEIKTDGLYGGPDTIEAQDGENRLFGGIGPDTITTGSGNNIVLGDGGMAEFDELGKLARITTTDIGTGDSDSIIAGTGDDIIFGGDGGDHIQAGEEASADIIVGDNGIAFFSDGVLVKITSDVDATAPEAELVYDDPSIAAADTIQAGGGTDVVIGGDGADQIDAGTDDSIDIVVGDNGTATFTSDRLITRIESILPGVGGDDEIVVGDGNDVVIAGAGNDYLNVDPDTQTNIANDSGDDVMLGDDGVAIFEIADGSSRLTSIWTLDNDDAGNDFIYAGNGSDVVLGGFGNDFIDAANGNNTVLGDGGRLEFTAGILRRAVSTGNRIETDEKDEISTGTGDNVVFGGPGQDEITTGTGNNIAVGDNGFAEFDDKGELELIVTSEPSVGTKDEISALDGNAVVLGGAGGDQIMVGSGNNTVVGDEGRIEFIAGVLQTIQSVGTEGGPDKITSGAGDNRIIGGVDKDEIQTGTGNNVVLGDNGIALFDAAGNLTQISTTDVDTGDRDDITAGGGADVILGGDGGDLIRAGNDASVDIILGDHGSGLFSANAVRSITSTAPTKGGNDTIRSGGGDDIVFGGTASDTIFGEGDRDVLLGDHGSFDASKAPDEQVLSIFSGPDLGADNDSIYGGDGDDLILGQQGDDLIVGGLGEDDLIGGHNVIGGVDGNDTILGGNSPPFGFEVPGSGSPFDPDIDVVDLDGADVILGDNGIITRQWIVDPTTPNERWQRYPAPFADVIRGIERFDDIDLVAGNDRLYGQGGDDIVLGQRGNDVLAGDSGDDELIGHLGDDSLSGGTGHDVLVADAGQVVRAVPVEWTPGDQCERIMASRCLFGRNRFRHRIHRHGQYARIGSVARPCR